MKKILVVEAHSDDSAIGAYGFLRKRSLQGDKLYFLAASMSSMNLNHIGFVSRKTRMMEYADYVKKIGGQLVEGFIPFDMESRMDTMPKADIVKAFENVNKRVKPDIIVCQAPSFHHDHTLVYESMIAALRPTTRIQPDEILLMENPTYVHSLGPTTDFIPNTYCQLTEGEMEEKINIFCSCFPSQIRSRQNCLSPEGIRAWAKYRGLESMLEPYAEAFVTFRRRIR